MKKLTILAAFFIATTSVTMTSCVKDSESASVESVRTAKAEQLKAIAAMQKAEGEAILIAANAEKVLKEAQAKLIEAEAALIAAETEFQKTKTEVAKVALDFAKMELEKIASTLESDLATLIAKAEKSRLEAERELENLIKKYKLEDADQSNAYLNKLIAHYSIEVKKFNDLTDRLIKAEHKLALNKSNWDFSSGVGLEQLKLIKEYQIALNNATINSNNIQIEAYKSIPMDNMDAIKAQMDIALSDASKYDAEWLKAVNDADLYGHVFDDAYTTWFTNYYNQTLRYIEDNQIVIPYISYNPEATDGIVGDWNFDVSKYMSTSTWVPNNWESGSVVLANGANFGPFKQLGYFRGYNKTNVDMPTLEQAERQWKLVLVDAVRIEKEQKARWDKLVQAQINEINKLNIYTSDGNIKAEFEKWHKLSDALDAAIDKFVDEFIKVTTVEEAAQIAYDKAVADADAKLAAGEITPVQHEIAILTAKADQKSKNDAQILAAENAYKVAFNAFEVLDAESKKLEYGYFQPFLAAVNDAMFAAYDYYEAANALAYVQGEVDQCSSIVKILKSADAQTKYNESLAKLLLASDEWMDMKFVVEVASANYLICNECYNVMFRAYSDYESIKDAIFSLEIENAELLAENNDYSAITTKEALIAAQERKISLIKTKLQVCSDLVAKYKGMIDTEMAKK